MKRSTSHIFVVLFLLSVLAAAALFGVANAQTLTCGTNGDFNSGGAINTQATKTGPRNMTLASKAGAITYPSVANGPASGTPVTCTLTGGGNDITYNIYCDASATITNNAGCCGATDRSITAFNVSTSNGKGGKLTDTACKGMATSAGTYRTDAGGNMTITVGGTMDITYSKIGSSYKLSNHATGPVNVKVIDVPTTTTYGPVTADMSVTFTSLVGFASTTGLNYGNANAPVAPGAGDHMDLGTNGTINFVGGFSSSPGGAPTAGQVTINNVENGMTVEVYCDTTLTLAKAGASTSTIQVTGVKVAPEGSTGTYAGAGTACAGTGTVATTMSYTSGSADQFFFGGVLDGGTTTNWSNTGTYASSNAGGTNMQVIVLNQ